MTTHDLNGDTHWFPGLTGKRDGLNGFPADPPEEVTLEMRTVPLTMRGQALRSQYSTLLKSDSGVRQVGGSHGGLDERHDTHLAEESRDGA